MRQIEAVIDNMSGPMLDFALDELKNLQFEIDMLNRVEQKNNKQHLVTYNQMQLQHS